MKKCLLVFAGVMGSLLSFAQLTPNGNTGTAITSYTNGASNDPVYIWCGTTLAAAQGSLTATPTSGVGPYTFNWYYHDQNTSSWANYQTQSGATSTISGLASDGYRVEIRDATNAIVDCFVAWVWNLNTQVVASNTVASCNTANLSSTVNTTGSFSYYNPPPPESLINASTQVQVCFTATHTFVSDLGFYMVGPAACGSPTIVLSPNPGSNGQGSVCNSGDNVNNLCFSSSVSANFDPCASSAPYTGTYNTYGPTSTAINWSAFIGCNAAAGGWAVQIYDCIGADVGALTNATITFSNLTSVCGSPTSITYNSGSISSTINDNSCSAATASIFQVPVSSTLNTPITMNATTTLLWTNSVGLSITNNTSATASAAGLPGGSTDFVLTATTSYSATSCTSADTTSASIVMPTVSGGANQSACGGASVTLSGSGAQTYTWDNGVTNGVAFVPTATTTYTVIGTAANGCQDTAQVTVTVAPSPAIDAGSAQSVCSGASVTLNGSGGVSYTWNNGVQNGVAFIPSATTTYTVTGTDASGCTNTDQVTVTVNALPAVDAGSAQAICPGGTVILNGSGAVSYTWDNGVTNGVSFTPVATTTYTVTGTDANGCVNTDQVVVTVYTLPTIDAGSPQSVCAGTSVTLSGSGGVSYTWNNSISNGVAFTPTTTQTYTVVGTDANGCQNTDQVVVTVNALPTIDAGVNQTVCLGTAVILSGTGGVSYTWSGGVVNNTPFNPALGSVSYTVTGTDANGCSNTDQVTVVVVPVPVAGMTSADPLSGYPGLVIDFTNTSQFATDYDFDFDNGQTLSTTDINEVGTATFGSPGQYIVVLTASNGICQDTAQIHVLVLPYEPLVVHVPNVFTPDGDGINDFFLIDVQNGTAINVQIVNRWGNFIAEWSDFTTSWDGQINGDPASEGVYFVKYVIEGKDGTTQNGQTFVELMRK